MSNDQLRVQQEQCNRKLEALDKIFQARPWDWKSIEGRVQRWCNVEDAVNMELYRRGIQ